MVQAAGFEVCQRHEELVACLQKVLDVQPGHGVAAYNLGVMYLDGRGIKKQIEKAISLFEVSRRTGYAHASYMLGQIYSDAKDLPADMTVAFKMFEESRQAGNVELACSTENCMGSIYAQGMNGIRKNLAMALELFKAALARNSSGGAHMSAVNVLGCLGKFFHANMQVCFVGLTSPAGQSLNGQQGVIEVMPTLSDWSSGNYRVGIRQIGRQKPVNVYVQNLTAARAELTDKAEGTIVCISGLIKGAALNGELGIVTTSVENGRVGVRIGPHKVVSIRVNNLEEFIPCGISLPQACHSKVFVAIPSSASVVDDSKMVDHEVEDGLLSGSTSGDSNTPTTPRTRTASIT